MVIHRNRSSHIRTGRYRHALLRAVVVLAALVVSVHWSVSPSRAQVIETSAQYAFVLDDTTGSVLMAKNADVPVVAEGMTKLMTLELAFQAIKEGSMTLEDEIFISENAWRTGGAPSRKATMFASVNKNIRLEDALRGIMIHTANDASIAIAEAMAGSEAAFSVLMNERAQNLGLQSSSFVNATGMPTETGETNKMSMRDLVTLARHIIHEYPGLYGYFSEAEFTWNNIRQLNKNPIISMSVGADGLLTGYDPETKSFGIVASSTQKGVRIIAAIHGLTASGPRTSEILKLLAWGANSFDKVTLFEKGDPVGEIGVYGGEVGRVALVGEDRIQILVPRGAKTKLRARIVYDGPLLAPVAEGQSVGVLQISNDEEIVSEIPLFASQSVEVGPLYSRALDAAYELLVGLIHSGLNAASTN